MGKKTTRDDEHEVKKEKKNPRPWQVDWKNPSWTSFEQSTEVKGNVVGVSAAEVSTAELCSELPGLEFDGLRIDPDENDHHWVVTTTLLDPSGKSSNPPVATKLVIEIADCESEKVVHSRHLTWPESAAASPDDNSGILNELGSFLLPWRSKDNERTIHKSPPERGLVSAVLCRQPLRKDARKEEAMEVISSMMIGLDSLASPEETNTFAVTRDPMLGESGRELDDDWQNIEQPVDPLCLAGVSTEGLVCIYSLWSLLLTSTSRSTPREDPKAPNISDDQAMSAWLLGSDLFEHLESTWLPLAQPITTISLSILRGTGAAALDHVDHTTGSETSSGANPTKISKVGMTSWSPWVENTTLRHRTVLNRITSVHVVSSKFPFLVLLGEGLKLAHPLKTSKALYNGKSATVSKSLSDMSLSDDEWWKDEDDSDHFPTKKGFDKSSAMLETDNTSASPRGGFVTFCSMASWIESKTLFLDFVPVSVSYVERWHGMQLLLCIGDQCAVAIRVDAAADSILVGMDEDLETMLGGAETYKVQHPSLKIPRFTLLPIDLQSDMAGNNSGSIKTRILCAGTTLVPSLLQLYTEVDRTSQKEIGVLAIPRFAGMSENGVIKTATPSNAVAQAPSSTAEHSSSLTSFESSWGYLGQGWSLFCVGHRIFFMCWEGATATRGAAFIQEMESPPGSIFSNASLARVLLLSDSKPSNKITEALKNSARTAEYGLLEEVSVPEFRNLDDALTDSTLERIVSVNSAADISFQRSLSTESDMDVSALSHREKSERILRKVSSWTQLEDTVENRERLQRDTPVIVLRAHMGSQASRSLGFHALNMREVVIENGDASPFSQVLGWLSQKRDYFTAASIALDMLQDPDTLYHLWGNAERIDEEDEQNKLKGLLDGIIPISITENPDRSPESATIRQLADMTVGCLIKGGLAMSNTLARFLNSNMYYDPHRASLMLVATCVSVVYGDSETVTLAMGQTDRSDFTIGEMLWPVECLMEIAIARDHLPSILDLLNKNISDVLRGWSRPSIGSISGKSGLHFTTALITTIVSKDRLGVDHLLALPRDGDPSLTYWESLESITQEAFVLIRIDGVYPMLLHQEVREWSLHQLQGNRSSKEISTIWLQEIVSACLVNAGCRLSDFVFEPINVTMTSFNSGNSATWVDLELDGEDGLYQYKLQVTETRAALEPSVGSTGLDFDILISALLLLESRNEKWNEKDARCVSTQGLLDAACHLAGRPKTREDQPRFDLDAAVLMQQCAKYDNMRAGANLVGGTNGFVLKCCKILRDILETPIEMTEQYLLSDSIETLLAVSKDVATSKNSGDFVVSNAHRNLLWLLDENVLSVRTYGEFDLGLDSRGRVDPVFAARVIFRVWLVLTYPCRVSASVWLCEWLTGRLGLGKEGSGVHRLACAAITRALLWPDSDSLNHDTSNDESIDQRIGHLLNLDTYFLVKLAEASCGLLESIPPSVAEGLLSFSEVNFALEASMTLSSTNRLNVRSQGT